jgi:hypothetical protein
MKNLVAGLVESWRFRHSYQARKWCRLLSIAEPKPATDEADFGRLAKYPESQASAVRSSGKDPAQGGDMALLSEFPT